MAEKDKDKLADALRALAGGQHVEPEGTPSETDAIIDLTPAAKAGRPVVPGSMPPTPAPPRPPAAGTGTSAGAEPAPARPVAKPPATAPLFRSSAPPQTPPATSPAPPPPSVRRPATPGAPVPPAPARPAPARPIKPRVARPERPAMPIARGDQSPPSPPSPDAEPSISPDGDPEAADQLSVTDAADEDDDVQLDLPAATPDMFAHVPAHPRSTAAVVNAVSHSLGFKRTIIPILLTCGMLLLATASLKWALGGDSPMARLPIGVVAACGAVGAVLLAVAALNMLQVRDELARGGRDARPGG